MDRKQRAAAGLRRSKLSKKYSSIQPIRVKNPFARLLADPVFKQKKVVNPNTYTRKTKHKKGKF